MQQDHYGTGVKERIIIKITYVESIAGTALVHSWLNCWFRADPVIYIRSIHGELPLPGKLGGTELSVPSQVTAGRPPHCSVLL